VFAEAPNNHYEWIEPPRPTLTKQTSVDSLSSVSSVYSSPGSSVTYSSPPSSRIMSSPDTPYSFSRPGSGKATSDDPRKRPLPPIPSPHVAVYETRSAGITGRQRADDGDAANDSPYEDFEDTHQTRSGNPHRPAERMASQPLPRTGSVDHLLDDGMVDRRRSAGRTTRLSSSHSMECLCSDSPSTVTSGSASSASSDVTFFSLPRHATSRQNADELTSSSETVTLEKDGKKYRPPIAAKPKLDDRNELFMNDKHNSMLQRQRPVVRVRRGGFSGSNISLEARPDIYQLQRSATTTCNRVQSVPMTTTSSLYDIYPFPSRDVKSLVTNPYELHHPDFTNLWKVTGNGCPPRDSLTSSTSTITPSPHDDEGVYDQIGSPIYVDMNKLKSPKGASQPQTRLSQNKEGIKTNTNTQEDTRSPCDIDGKPIVMYDQPAPGSRPVDDLSALYANCDELAGHQPSHQHAAQSSVKKTRKRRVKVTKKTDDQSAFEPANVVSSEVDSEDQYLKPFVLLQTGKVERGQGVGAEMKQENGSLVQPTALDNTAAISSAKSAACVAQSGTDNNASTYCRTIAIHMSSAAPRWTTLSDVPDDVTSLTVEDVVDCLRLLSLHKYVDVFRHEQIDGTLLTSLDQQMLIQEFHFNPFHALKLVKFACHGWRPKFASTQPPHSDC